MGCTISWASFQCFSTLLERCLHTNSGSCNVTHYHNDFLFTGTTNYGSCQALIISLSWQMNWVVPLVEEKESEGPATVATFLCFEFDINLVPSRLPQSKLDSCQAQTEIFHQNEVILHAFQLLLGLLNFNCKIVVPGRGFCAQLYVATEEIRAPQDFICISEMEEDWVVWVFFLFAIMVCLFGSSHYAFRYSWRSIQMIRALEFIRQGDGALPLGLNPRFSLAIVVSYIFKIFSYFSSFYTLCPAFFK